MAYTSEIEKLERRYAENPKGRNFAPLADAYRKAGQLDQAIELCKSGLERHPDYVSAHIVYGRCLLDKKDDPGVEAVFRKVLDLDPENVIAFKVLADVADRAARYEETVQWLTRLLTADPMNGDAADALAVAKRRAAEQAPVVAPPPPSPVVPPTVAEVPAIEEPGVAVATFASAETKMMDAGELMLERASVVTRMPDLPASRPAAEVGAVLETFDGTTRVEPGTVTAGTEGIELQEEVSLTPANVVIEGLARNQYEASGVFKLDPPVPAPPAAEALQLQSVSDAPEPGRRDGVPLMPSELASPPAASGVGEEVLEDLPSVDLPLIMPEDVARGSRRARTTPPAPRSPPRRPAAFESPVRMSDDDGAADTAALSRVEPVLTETMAELYLRQGHTEDAVRVYEALLAQRPGDRRLQGKVDSLTGRGVAASGQTVRAFLHALFTGHPAPAELVAAPVEAALAMVDTSSLSGAFAHAPSDGEIPGVPTHLSEDTLSLDQVFGDDAPPSGTLESTSPAPAPAEPAPRTPPSLAGQRTTGFSFDEFFDAGSRTAPAASGSSPAPPSIRPSARVKAAAEDESDLDQFQAWLKGLKA